MTSFRLLAAGLLLASLLSRPATAQILDPSFSSPTSLYAPGQIYAMGPQQADSKRVVAGSFSRINGTAVSSFVRLDATGALDLPFSQNVGTVSNVYRIKGLPSGQYLLGAYGGSVTAGGLVLPELLRLNTNGTADASFNPGTGPTDGTYIGYSTDFAAQPDGKILVVGYFDAFNNVTAKGVVRLNTNGSVDTGFTTGTGIDTNTSGPTAVAVQPDGKILVGGDFTTFNGQPAINLVRLNANGSIDPSFSSPFQGTSYVYGLVLQPDGKLLVYGSFTLNGTGAQIARLNANGSADPTFTTSTLINGGIYNNYDPAVVLQPDGKILVSGNFTTAASGGAFNSLARLNANGSLDNTFVPSTGTNAVPNAVGLQSDGSVIVGGSFSVFNGSERPLQRLTSSGVPDPAFAPSIQIPGSVTAMARQADGKVVIGGNFTEINGQAVHRLARLSDTGVLDVPYSAATGVVGGSVAAIVLQPDGKALAGTSAGLFRFMPSGSPDASFVPPYTSATYALAIQPDGRILWSVGVASSTFRYLLRLTSSGAYDPSFSRPLTSAGPGTPNLVDAILVQPDGKIVVGGSFRPATGTTSICRVVRYDASGALDATFNNLSAFTAVSGTSSTTNRIYSLALQPNGQILAGGNFGAVDGSVRYGVARLSATGTVDATFASNSTLTGNVYSLALQPNGRILVGGSFTNTSTTGSLGNNLTRVLANGQTDASFTPTALPNSTVRSLVVQPDGAILLAGSFTSIGGQPALNVARIVAGNVLHVAAPAAVAERTTAWPVPAHGQLHIALDASAQPLTIELLDVLGRPVRTQPATSATEQTMNLDNLSAGVYSLRVSYAAGTVTRRIVVQ